MAWVTFPETKARCNLGPGEVQADETVARLLHSNNAEPRKKALTVSELFWDNAKGPPSNVCGESDGTSVDRCSTLDDDEIRKRAQAQAAQKAGRSSHGAMIAKVGVLRIIVPPGRNGQVLFVYDDPKPDNHEHAVIRGDQALGPSEQRFVRDQMLAAFQKVVAPQV